MELIIEQFLAVVSDDLREIEYERQLTQLKSFGIAAISPKSCRGMDERSTSKCMSSPKDGAVFNLAVVGKAFEGSRIEVVRWPYAFAGLPSTSQQSIIENGLKLGSMTYH